MASAHAVTKLSESLALFIHKRILKRGLNVASKEHGAQPIRTDVVAIAIRNHLGEIDTPPDSVTRLAHHTEICGLLPFKRRGTMRFSSGVVLLSLELGVLIPERRIPLQT